SFPGRLPHGREEGFSAWRTDPRERPGARRAAGGGRFRFSPGANRRDWPRCACAFYSLRARLRGGGRRAGSCGWARHRCTWVYEITCNRTSQEDNNIYMGAYSAPGSRPSADFSRAYPRIRPLLLRELRINRSEIKLFFTFCRDSCKISPPLPESLVTFRNCGFRVCLLRIVSRNKVCITPGGNLHGVLLSLREDRCGAIRSRRHRKPGIRNKEIQFRISRRSQLRRPGRINP